MVPGSGNGGAEEQGAITRFQAEANANTGTTNLGALLKAKLSGGNEYSGAYDQV